VTDLDLHSEDGARLLERLEAHHPTTLRVIYSARADRWETPNHGLAAHAAFAKAQGPEPLLAYLQQALVSPAVKPDTRRQF
jgi:DNA-binding NarL/FixJ family response regulator